MPASGGATVRVTTTTTTSSASILVINTGYLKTKEGIVKLLILLLTIIVFVLVMLETQSYSHYFGRSYGFYANDLFLLLVSFAGLFTTSIMLLTCVTSLGTASLLPKISFDFTYHILCCLFFFISGLWVLIDALDKRTNSIVAASVIALVISFLHLIHGIFSYRLCRVR